MVPGFTNAGWWMQPTNNETKKNNGKICAIDRSNFSLPQNFGVANNFSLPQNFSLQEKLQAQT
jgi:hypothetical protein